MSIGISAAPWVRYNSEGDEHGGEIVGFRKVQKTDFDSNRPLYYQRNSDGSGEKTFAPFSPDGTANQPIFQWEFTVDTGQEDENGETERRIFLDPQKGRKGTALEGKRGGDAVNNAVRAAKANRVGVEIGGSIWIRYEGKVRADRKSPETKTWTARYAPPAGGPGSGKPLDDRIHLYGGGVFDPNEREAAPVAQSFSLPATPAFGVPAPTGAAVGAGGGVPVAAARVQDEEPPF